MALVRLALRNLQQRVCGGGSSSSSSLIKQRWSSNNDELLLARFASTAASDKGKSEGGTEVAVSEGNKNKSRLFPRRRGRRSWLSRNQDRDLFPAPFGTIHNHLSLYFSFHVL